MKNDADYLRYRRLMPRSRDICLLILKGHLLVEEQLESCISAELRTPDVLKEARLDCFQKIKLVQGFYGDQNDYMWKAVIRLNKIRNKYAHSLEPIGIEQIIDSWLKDWFEDEDLKTPFDSKKRAKYIKNVIAFICGCLSGMRNARIEFRKYEKDKLKDYRDKERSKIFDVEV